MTRNGTRARTEQPGRLCRDDAGGAKGKRQVSGIDRREVRLSWLGQASVLVLVLVVLAGAGLVAGKCFAGTQAKGSMPLAIGQNCERFAVGSTWVTNCGFRGDEYL